MPKATIATNATAVIGSTAPTGLIPGARKSLVITLISGTAYWGWTTAVTAAGVDDAGIPMVIGQPVAFDAESLRMNAPLRVFASADAVVNYQENFQP